MALESNTNYLDKLNIDGSSTFGIARVIGRNDNINHGRVRIYPLSDSRDWLYIENNEVRYDIRTDRHGHFKCVKCGQIYDVEIYDVKSEMNQGESDFIILSEEVNYRGICNNCKENNLSI